MKSFKPVMFATFFLGQVIGDLLEQRAATTSSLHTTPVPKIQSPYQCVSRRPIDLPRKPDESKCFPFTTTIKPPPMDTVNKEVMKPGSFTRSPCPCAVQAPKQPCSRPPNQKPDSDPEKSNQNELKGSLKPGNSQINQPASHPTDNNSQLKAPLASPENFDEETQTGQKWCEKPEKTPRKPPAKLKPTSEKTEGAAVAGSCVRTTPPSDEPETSPPKKPDKLQKCKENLRKIRNEFLIGLYYHFYG